MVLLSWLSTLKFILFACSYKGALSSNPPLSFPHFLLIASFLIKCQHKLVSKLSNHTNNQIKVTSLNWSNKLLVIFILFIFIFYSSIWYETKVLSDNFDDLVHSPSVRDLSCIDHCNHSQTCWSRVGAAFQQTSFKHIGARLSGKKVEHYDHTYPTPYGVQTNGESLGGLGTMLGYVFFFLIQKYARQNLCLKKSTTLSMQLSLITLVTK
jgi:hypothetical protein